MKKILIYGALTIAVVAGTCLVSRSNTPSDLTTDQLANIIALADGESATEVVKCYCKTNIFSPNVCSANASGAYCGGDPCSNHDGNCR